MELLDRFLGQFLDAGQRLRHSSDDAPKLGVLGVNSMHIIEHYGNLVTYMRMKNIVPPTSEPGAKAEPKE